MSSYSDGQASYNADYQTGKSDGVANNPKSTTNTSAGYVKVTVMVKQVTMLTIKLVELTVLLVRLKVRQTRVPVMSRLQ